MSEIGVVVKVAKSHLGGWVSTPGKTVGFSFRLVSSLSLWVMCFNQKPHGFAID